MVRFSTGRERASTGDSVAVQLDRDREHLGIDQPDRRGILFVTLGFKDEIVPTRRQDEFRRNFLVQWWNVHGNTGGLLDVKTNPPGGPVLLEDQLAGRQLKA